MDIEIGNNQKLRTNSLNPRSKRHYKRLLIYCLFLLVVLPLFAVSFAILEIGQEFLVLLSLSLATISISLAILSQTEPKQWYPEDIRYLISSSDPLDWEYREWSREQFSEYVLKANREVILRFEPINESEEFHEPWVENYPDTTAYRRRLNIIHSGQRYETVHMISVDGRRTRVPMPKSARDTTITEFEYNLGKIVNCAPAPGLARDVEEYEREYDRALQNGGIEVQKDTPLDVSSFSS